MNIMKSGLIYAFVFVIMIGSLISVSAQLSQQVSLDQSVANCERIKMDKEMCYYNLALGVQNVEYCKKSGILMDDCYKNIAEMTNLPSLCSESGGREGDFYASLAMKNNNLGLCNEAGAVYKEYCYSKIAVAKNDVRVCNSLKGDGWGNFFGFFKSLKSQRTICVESVKTKPVIV